MSFEPVITETMKEYLSKWMGKPRDKYDREKVQHYTAILGKDKQWFLDTFYLAKLAYDSLPEVSKDKYKTLWQALRDSGWRYMRYHENDACHWYCTFDVFRSGIGHDLREPSEQEIEGWEKEIDEGWQA
jgi:hypothetical protein